MVFRKLRHNSDAPSAGPSRSSTAASKPTFSASTTLSSTLSSTSTNAAAEDPKGPLGLNLLYSPPDPCVDFVFVHGLGGGSRKTWSKTPLPSHYWPREWLPRDAAFQSVRIHSYGYDSDYLKGREDCLNVHHIGKSFLGALSTSPSLVGSRTRLVAIGHSMGGLVIKKAYILAKQDAAHKDLAGRFAAAYFLATPHRGADSAKILKNLLKVAYDRAYIADLERNSGAIQVINDEFRHVSAGLELWSFYETRNMKMFSAPIVDPESAVLGYREERQVPMNADHRSICKFDTPSDANYAVLRNALASTVGEVTAAMPEARLAESRERMKDLRTYLAVSDYLGDDSDDLASVRDARIDGSCQWISAKPSFARWRDGEELLAGSERTLWIKGQPAAGKSVLAGYIVDSLREAGFACSYFFFRHGDKPKSRLGTCLRSLAFQMARADTEIGNAVLEMRADGMRLDNVDDRTLWRVLLSGIFRATKSRHYWVIDALDECSKPAVLFDAVLAHADKSMPLRTVITSRDTSALHHGFSGVPPGMVQSLSISAADTLPDLRLLIESRSQFRGVVGPEDWTRLAETILVKSKGSFLWTILVLKELQGCHSKKEITKILEDVPRGMESLYKRALDSMSQVTRGKELAKALLMWTACAIRPMTVAELNGALVLDMEDTFPRLEESISALCGQLLVTDRLGRVQMVHETARECLLSDTLDSEFAMPEAAAHTRMARVCLGYLVSDEMKPPRMMHRRHSSANKATTRSDFAAYALMAYSYHLARAGLLAQTLLQLVGQFMRSNILAWIEAMADAHILAQLIRTSRHLRTYVNACAVERSPLDRRLRELRQWVTDLARIPAAFASALTTSPSAIYALVPPFCPTSSMVHGTSGPARRLSVLGASSRQWDDMLLCMDIRRGQPSALRYGEDYMAVGLSSGSVSLYQVTSYQEHKVLDHGESVRLIAFKAKAKLVATCGLKKVKVWDTRSGELMHSLESPPRPLDMAFDGDTLLVASQRNYLASWDLGPRDLGPRDAVGPIQPAQRPWSNTADETTPPPRQPPCALAISTSHGMLAVAYSGKPITLWDMEEDAYAGSCGKKLPSGQTSTHVVVNLVFNPKPSLALLVVAYLDGDLALLDPFADRQLECFRANCQTLAASPDGRLLAAGGAGGTVHVYEFDTLRLLYRARATNSYIKHVGFAHDGLHLADIRATQCTVWEPEALLREALGGGDDSSGTASTGNTSGSVVETVSLDAGARITAIAVHHTAEVVFCGRDDGAVVLYRRSTAAAVRRVCTHKSPVGLLVWCRRSEALLSIDASNRIFLHRVGKPPQQDQGWSASAETTTSEMLFQSRLESDKAVVDVLVAEAADKFIMSTRESDHLFALQSGVQERERPCPDAPGIRRWVPHPQSALHVLCFDDVSARIYCWTDWSLVGVLSLALQGNALQLQRATMVALDNQDEQRILLEFTDRIGPNTTTTSISIYDANSFAAGLHGTGSESDGHQADLETPSDPHATDGQAENTTRIPRRIYPLRPSTLSLASFIAHVIGITESGKMVFLSRSSWVCSVGLSQQQDPHQAAGDTTAAATAAEGGLDLCRHFFVPYDWLARSREVVCALAQRDIVMTRGGNLVIVRGGFEYAERHELEK